MVPEMFGRVMKLHAFGLKEQHKRCVASVGLKVHVPVCSHCCPNKYEAFQHTKKFTQRPWGRSFKEGGPRTLFSSFFFKIKIGRKISNQILLDFGFEYRVELEIAQTFKKGIHVPSSDKYDRKFDFTVLDRPSGWSVHGQTQI